MANLATAKSLAGVGRIPSSRPAVLAWLTKNGIVPAVPPAKANSIHLFRISDLPSAERRAYIETQITSEGLAPGSYDAAAHDKFAQAPASMRATAERKAEIARLLCSCAAKLAWTECASKARDQFGVKGTSNASLKRLLKDIEGVAPINFAPALLPAHKGRVATAEISENAWGFFLASVRDAAPTHIHFGLSGEMHVTLRKCRAGLGPAIRQSCAAGTHCLRSSA